MHTCLCWLERKKENEKLSSGIGKNWCICGRMFSQKK
jgi:hypothetical protein